MDELLTLSSLAAFATLAILEIVLGIDNIVFLAILTGKLPAAEQPKARTLGLMLAAVGRVALLFAISWVITLDSIKLFNLPFALPGEHVHAVAGQAAATPAPVAISIKDVVLFLGGLFLLAKSTWEIGHQLEADAHGEGGRPATSFVGVLIQILVIDLVFSLDSVLTAVGMVRPDDYDHHWVPLAVMIAAVLASIGVMMIFSGPIAGFVNRHPSVKMLALSFLILIGVVLIAEGFHSHVPRGYIYFAMGFSLVVEMLNLRAANRLALERESETSI